MVKRDAAVTPTAPNSAENEAEEEKDRKRREEEADIVKRCLLMNDMYLLCSDNCV